LLSSRSHNLQAAPLLQLVDHVVKRITWPIGIFDAQIVGSKLPNQPQAQISTNDDMDIDNPSVNMVVVDGIVMGPTVCKYTL
jgi:hypothetical protein